MAVDKQKQDDHLHNKLHKTENEKEKPKTGSEIAPPQSYLDIWTRRIAREKELEGQTDLPEMFRPRVASGLFDPWEDLPHEQARVAQSDKQPELSFSRSDLDQYVSHRKTGLAKKSLDWINRGSCELWESTEGKLSRSTRTALRERVLAKYTSSYSHAKVLSFVGGFLKFLARTRMEPRYTSFSIYLEMPKAVKERKTMTSRIVTKDDIESVLRHIKQAHEKGNISASRAAQYCAFVIFGAFTGQRSEATIAKLTVGQFREALQSEKPVLTVNPSQDKIRMAHFVPLHPQVVTAIQAVLDGRKNDELLFAYSSFQMWIKRQKIPMSRFDGHFTLGDLRKWTEQHGDVIGGWDQSNRAFILTHGVGGVVWEHYKNPQREEVYEKYLHVWGASL
jgi:hypothetical protein